MRHVTPPWIGLLPKTLYPKSLDVFFKKKKTESSTVDLSSSRAHFYRHCPMMIETLQLLSATETNKKWNESTPDFTGICQDFTGKCRAHPWTHCVLTSVKMKMGLPDFTGGCPDFASKCRAHPWTHCVDSFARQTTSSEIPPSVDLDAPVKRNTRNYEHLIWVGVPIV